MKKIIPFFLFFLSAQFLFASDAIFYVYKPDRIDNKTASGEEFNENTLTCAHNKLPFGTEVYASYANKSIKMKVNDRIDFSNDDIFAVTNEAMRRLTDGNNFCINKVAYAVSSAQGDGITSWENGNKSKWYNIKGISSKNIFSLYSSLVQKGYKARFSFDGLELLYVSSSRLNKAKEDLKLFSVKTDNLKEVLLPQPPLRE